jgi:hypothetical protein
MKNILACKLSIYTSVFLLASSCAVEAGNPSDKDKGTVKINITSDSSENTALRLTTSPQLELFVETIQLRGLDVDGNTIVSELETFAREIELYAIEDALLLTEGSVSIGTYETIIFILNDKQPFRYRPDGLNDKPLRFENSDLRAIEITQSFEVTSESSEELTIEFDLENAVQTQSEEFIFQPKVKPHLDRLGVMYEGSLDRDEGKAVCAYLYNAIRPEAQLPPPPPPRMESDQKPKPRPPAFAGLPPKSFAAKEDVIIDSTSNCENAFAKTRVEPDGTFAFTRLKPGTYTFQAFYNDKSSETIAEDVRLEPPTKD